MYQFFCIKMAKTSFSSTDWCATSPLLPLIFPLIFDYLGFLSLSTCSKLLLYSPNRLEFKLEPLELSDCQRRALSLLYCSGSPLSPWNILLFHLTSQDYLGFLSLSICSRRFLYSPTRLEFKLELSELPDCQRKALSLLYCSGSSHRLARIILHRNNRSSKCHIFVRISLDPDIWYRICITLFFFLCCCVMIWENVLVFFSAYFGLRIVFSLCKEHPPPDRE